MTGPLSRKELKRLSRETGSAGSSGFGELDPGPKEQIRAFRARQMRRWSFLYEVKYWLGVAAVAAAVGGCVYWEVQNWDPKDGPSTWEPPGADDRDFDELRSTEVSFPEGRRDALDQFHRTLGDLGLGQYDVWSDGEIIEAGQRVCQLHAAGALETEASFTEFSNDWYYDDPFVADVNDADVAGVISGALTHPGGCAAESMDAMFALAEQSGLVE